MIMDDLITPIVRAQLDAVLAHGAVKHAVIGPHSWPRAHADEHAEHAIQHCALHRCGTVTDDESGQPHLAHAVIRALMALAMLERLPP